MPSRSPSRISSRSHGGLDSDDGELLSGWEDDSGPERVKGYLISLPDCRFDPTLNILIFSTVKSHHMADIDDEKGVALMADLATRYEFFFCG